MPSFKKLLIVDGDINYCQTLAKRLSRRYQVSIATTAKEAQLQIPSQKFDLAIIEQRLPDANGLSLLEFLRSQAPHCRVLMLTLKGNISSAVEAMRLGALDYLPKPISPECIQASLLGKTSGSQLDLDERPLTLAENEQNYLEFVMIQCGGNISYAAQCLGIHRQSLQRMLKRVVTPNL